MTSHTKNYPIELEETAKPTPEDELQITLTQEKLKRMKSHLTSLTDAMGKNKSLVSKAAESLDNIPLWVKIAVGITLTLPFLVIGLIWHIGLLLLISSMIALTYVVTVLLLDEHHQSNLDVTKDIKDCLSNVADLMAETIQVLAKTIDALNKVRQELSAEINRLENQVTLLSDTAKSFTTLLESFIKNTNKSAKEQDDALKRLHDYICNGNQAIDSFNQLQEKLAQTENKLAQTQTNLAQTQTDLAQTQTKLSDTADKLCQLLLISQKNASDNQVKQDTSNNSFSFFKTQEANQPDLHAHPINTFR